MSFRDPPQEALNRGAGARLGLDDPRQPTMRPGKEPTIREPGKTPSRHGSAGSHGPAGRPPTGDRRLARFGVFELDLGTGELRKKGARVRLPDKPFRILAALLEAPGEMVTREDLCRRLWPDTAYGEFDVNLNSAVRKLRRALGDSAENPRFVETLPRRGYRFIAPVEELPREAVGAADAPESPSPERPGGVLALAAASLVIALGVAFLIVAASSGRPSAGDRGPERAGRELLAVLPFDNLDGDPEQDYFCDGLTEELIAQLGRLDPERLGVIARTSSDLYKGSEKGARAIGRELGVDYLLEGSVRSGGDRVRITAQLIQVADQTHLWSETYDTELADLLEVQGEVAVEVATVLALELLPDRPLALARSSTRVTEAYELYLRGRHEWNRFTEEGYRQAVRHFQRATELDPDYAAAWAGLANAYNLLSFAADTTPAEVFPPARRAAERAVSLDRRLAEAHAALGFVRLYFDYDLEGADRAFRRAVEARPNYAMAHHWHAGALSALERHDEAIAAMERAVELDPLSLSVQSDAGWYYLFADRPEEAVAECRRTLDTEEYGWARACLVQALVKTGDFQAAVERVREGLSPEERASPRWRAVLAEEDPQAALRAAQGFWLEDRRKRDPQGRYPVNLAFLQAAVGDLDGAFASLERAYELRDAWLVFLEVDPRFSPLRGDPRYRALVEKVGL